MIYTNISCCVTCFFRCVVGGERIFGRAGYPERSDGDAHACRPVKQAVELVPLRDKPTEGKV